jgi:hypothetical protein
MSLRSLVRPRLSAPLVVSFLALFVSLGGAGWAAFRLPAHSVGNAQLQNFSVGNAKLRPNSVGASKIIPGSVGARQVDSSQVQVRLTSGCLIGAIQSIAQTGNITCAPARPNEYGTTASNVALATAGTLVASVQLGGAPGANTYLAFGNVQWSVSGNPPGPQSVDLKCTLQGSSSTSGESITELDPQRTTQAGSIPIVAPATITGSHGLVLITCAYTAVPATPAPTVTVNATLSTLETAANHDS